MVLGRRADHRRAADVDVLDAVVVVGALRHRRLERVEVDHQQVDRLDPVRGHRRHMLGIVAQRQKPAMHHRVQRLHPAVHHLGKAGQLGHVAHRQPGLAQRRRGAAGRDELDPARGQRPREIDEPGLVGNGNQGAAECGTRLVRCGHPVMG